MENKLIIWIKKQLKLRNWSIRELSRRSNISHAYIAEVLRGDKDATWNFCLAIAHGLDVSVLKIFVLAGLLGEDDIPLEVDDDEELRLIIKTVNDLPLAARKEAINYLRWLKVQHESPPDAL